MGSSKFVDPVIWEISKDGSQFTGYKDSTRVLVIRSKFDESFIAYAEVGVTSMLSKSYYLGTFPDVDDAKEACVRFIRTGGKFGKETGVGSE